MYKSHRTHTGQIVTGADLQAALDQVALDQVAMAHAIFDADEYAGHVTPQEKAIYLQEGLHLADKIQAGDVSGFWIWQRVNTVLTGQCVAFLPPVKS